MGASASAVILEAVKNAGIGQRTLDNTGIEGNTRFMVTPEKVARAVVRAIEKDKAEIVVLPGSRPLPEGAHGSLPGLGRVHESRKWSGGGHGAGRRLPGGRA